MIDATHLIQTAGACISRQDWAGAADAFARLAEMTSPVPTAVAYNCGVAYRRAGDAAAALNWLDTALSSDPDHANAMFERAAAFVDLGRMCDALEAIALYLTRQPDDADALRTRARILLGLGRWQEAEAAWQVVASQGTEDAEARLARLRILAETGRHDVLVEDARNLLREGACPNVAILHELTHAGHGTLPLKVARLRD